MSKLFTGAITAMITSSAASGIAERIGLSFLKHYEINIKIGFIIAYWKPKAIQLTIIIIKN